MKLVYPGIWQNPAMTGSAGMVLTGAPLGFYPAGSRAFNMNPAPALRRL